MLITSANIFLGNVVASPADPRSHSFKMQFRARQAHVPLCHRPCAQTIRLMAVGHHKSVYEELTARLRKKTLSR